MCSDLLPLPAIAPNKMSKSSEPSTNKGGSDNLTYGEAVGTALPTEGNWSRAQAPALVVHSSQLSRNIVDAEDTDGDDGESDYGKQLVLS